MSFHILSQETVAQGIAAFAFAAAVLVAFRPQALTVLAVVAGVLIFPSDYWLRIRPIFHRWDQYHLFMTAKYFPELGYTNLYACALAADRQIVPERWQTPREVRDLTSNEIVLHNDLTIPDCQRLLGSRFEEFATDIKYFAHANEALRPGRWLDTFRDHGVNVTPVWAALYHPVVRFLPANEVVLAVLSIFDFALLLSGLFLVWKGFGATAGAMAVLTMSLNESSRAGWVVGSVFRFDWLFLLCASAYALKKNRGRLGLACAAMANGLRPVALLSLLLGARLAGWKTALSTGLVVLLCGFAFGASTWVDFANNAVKYNSSYLVNAVGLRPLILNMSPSQRLEQLPTVSSGKAIQSNESLYHALMSERENQLRFWLISCSAMLIIIVLIANFVAALDQAFALSVVVSWFILSPPSYYSVVILFLFLRPPSRFGLSAVLFVFGLTKLIPLVVADQAFAFQLQSGLLLLLLLPYLWSTVGLCVYRHILSRMAEDPGPT